MGGQEVEAAEKKAVSILFLALGDTARKTLMDRKPNLDVKQIQLRELIGKRKGSIPEKKK